MKLSTLLFILALLCGFPASAQRSEGWLPLEEWPAGEALSVEEIAQQGIEAFFVSEPLSDHLFGRMWGLSFKADCTVPREELRYLKVLHCNQEGETLRGELVCHADLAEDLLAIFRQLYEARYPIERMVLVDAYGADDGRSMADNNSSAFNFRRMVGSSKLSKHSLGRAVDINPRYNPYVKKVGDRLRVEPPEATPYVDRSKKFPYKITADDLCCRLFKAYGFTWGGDWHSLKDYQHFER